MFVRDWAGMMIFQNQGQRQGEHEEGLGEPWVDYGLPIEQN
jgi:hypothetical protein